MRKGQSWSLPLEGRVLLVAAYWWTDLTLRQLAPLFGVSKSAADRIIDHLGPALAVERRKRFRKDTGGASPDLRHAEAQAPPGHRA